MSPATDIEPGVYYGMSDEDYNRLDAIRHSDFSRLANPRRPGIARSSSLLGRATHVLPLLGREATRDAYFTSPDEFDLRTKAGKERLKELEAENPGKEILRPKETAQVVERVNALLSNPEAAALIDTGSENNEVVVVGRAGPGNLLLKAKIDMLRPHEGKYGMIRDLKGTHAPDRSAFEDSISKFRYHTQLPWYQMVYHAATGDWLDAEFLCVSHQTLKVWRRPFTWQEHATAMTQIEDILSMHQRMEELCAENARLIMQIGGLVQ